MIHWLLQSGSVTIALVPAGRSTRTRFQCELRSAADPTVRSIRREPWYSTRTTINDA
jgi:hypothetical protein